MRSVIATVLYILSLASGCGQSAAPARRELPTGHSTPPTASVSWSSSLTEDGDWFPDEASFRGYLQGSEIVAVGALTPWDRRAGTLRVERVIRGKADAEFSFQPNGGFIQPVAGQRVIALISPRDGKMVLHSFCAAGGLYHYTEALAAYIEETFRHRNPN